MVERPQIVVGTPGRVKDMSERGYLKLDKAECVIIDEADKYYQMK